MKCGNVWMLLPGKVETPFDQASVVAEVPCRWKMRPCYFHR